MNFIETDVCGPGNETYVNLDLIKAIKIVKKSHLDVGLILNSYLVYGYFDYDDDVNFSVLLLNNGQNPPPEYNYEEYRKVCLFSADNGTSDENLAAAKRFVERIISKNV